MTQSENIKVTRYLRDLTENELRDIASPDYFKCGFDYYREGAVVNPKLYMPDKITAFVRGNLRPKYKIKIEAMETDIKASCTCLTGITYCKHVVATLLMWINFPEKFEVVKTEPGVTSGGRDSFIQEKKLQTILMNWDKQELVNKVMTLLKKSNFINEINYLVEFLNQDMNCKPEVYAKFKPQFRG
jgi:uncharacterized Zn finger protein